MEITFI